MQHPSSTGPATRAVGAATLAMVAGLAPIAAQDRPAGPAPAPAETKQEPQPWRLGKALDLPEWLKISGQVRMRYEGIEGQYRALNFAGTRRLDNSDHMFVTRTSLKAEADFDTFGATLELLDSRQFGAGNGSFLNNTVVNPIDFLQAYGEVRTGEFAGGSSRLAIGRETLDLGSRRLVARNAFRNTINAFDAVDWMWTGEDGSSLRTFWSLPVRRNPSDFQGLLDNEIEFDDQTSAAQFYGAFYATEIEGTALELYAFGLNETGSNTARRNYYTPGFRVVGAPKRAAVDYEWESAVQFGDRKQAGRELDHFAWFTHVSVGYTFDVDWQPRLRLAYDYATGDDNPADGDSGRFDTLFGARRFEYGPTGIHGTIARSNISSPEIRLEARPNKRTDCFIAWRWLWLAEGGDQWTTARLTDTAGNADNYVGNQIEARIRYDLVPKNVRVETGIAHLFAGDFMENVAQSRGEDSTYFYAQMFLYF